MKSKIHIVSLGGKDLKKTTQFYIDLGFDHTEASNESISFLQLDHQLLGLYPSNLLEEDAGIKLNHDGHAKMALAHNVDSRSEVDVILNNLPNGGVVIKQAQDVFWGGYSGYFADPDGHLWEVAYNPFFSLDENGSLRVINKS